MSPLRPLALGLALAALLALPVSASAVLPGENGRIVYISGPAFANTQLFLRGVTGSTGGGTKEGPLSPGMVQRRHPTWSPDRTRIAYAEGPGGAAGYDIYILDLTTPGATPRNITNSSGVTDDRPAWSPDGTRIAYESGNDIIVHTLNGATNRNLTTTLAPRAWKAAWSSGSQTLYYSVGDITVAPNGNNNDAKIYRQPANNSSPGTELLHISGAHVFQPAISPDGTKLCYTTSTQASALPTSAAIFAAPLSAPGSFTVVAASGVGDYNCTWSPDGTTIAYAENYAGNGEIYMENADGSSLFPINLSNAPGLYDGNPDWAPDGRPTCPNTTVATVVDTPVTFRVDCTDTGPAYERTRVREFKRTDPANGTVAQELAGDPFTYTPNQNFSGTDTFQVSSFDEFGFGTDTSTVRIIVRLRGGGGGGGPTASCGGLPATIVGTAGAEVILGTRQRDVIAALGGNDTVRGGRGRDVICGSSGRDRIGGGGGNDRIGGGSGGDRLAGNGGNDRVSGNGGNDTESGGGGRDALSGNAGRDRLSGGPGGDRLNGGAARDRCVGGRGTDSASRCESRASIP
ncbi:MAG TPA: Ig-like domain-containing protein [Thermoleophilaceae bacterium]|nr:Ig-like domain-containing protein [Thermoleophilaceae bacterium]